jgi:tetratricopeptide (TPR) repeat protein
MAVVVASRYLSRGILAVVATIALMACDSASQEDQARAHLKSSIAYQQQGQFRAAIIEARNGMRSAPQQVDCYVQTMSLYNQLGFYRNTLELLPRVPETADPDVVLQKARALIGIKKYRSALEELRTIATHLELEQSSYFQLYLGEAQAGLGQLDDARLSLQQAASGAAGEQAMLEIARISLTSNNSRTAMTMLEGMLAKNPQNADALLLAAQIATDRSNYAQAADYLTLALSYLPPTDIILPQRISALRLMSRVATMRGHAEEALRYNNLLSAELPEQSSSQGMTEQALALIEAGQLDSAEALLTNILEHNSDHFAGTLLGIVSYMRGDLNAAADILSTHLDPETANNQALELLVSTRFQLNQIDQVLEILEPELQTRGDNATLLGLYGLAKLAKQDLDGLNDIDKSLQLNPANSRLQLAMVSLYQQQDLPQKALQQAQLAYSYAPADPRVQAALMRLLVSNQELEKAEKLAKQIAETSPTDSQSLTLAANTLLRLGKVDIANRYLHQAVAIDQQNISARMALARIAFGRQDFASAEQYYLDVLAMQPASIAAYQGIVSSYEARQDVASSLALLQSQAAKLPANGIPLAVIAEYYLRNQLLQQALPPIEQALQRQAMDPYIDKVALEIYRQAAAQALGQGDSDAARQLLSQGLAHLPNTVSLLELLARLEAREQNAVATRETIDLLMQLAPATAHEVNGDLLSAESPQEALAAYANAWDIQASSALARKTYHLLLALDPLQAEAFAKDWSTQLPGDASLFLARAMRAQQVEDIPAAIREYEQLLALQPNHLTALNNLAWLYTGLQDSRALPLAQNAQRLSPSNPAVLDTLAMALLAAGKKEEAVQWLQRAQQLAPEASDIEEHLEQALTSQAAP